MAHLQLCWAALSYSFWGKEHNLTWSTLWTMPVRSNPRSQCLFTSCWQNHQRTLKSSVHPVSLTAFQPTRYIISKLFLESASQIFPLLKKKNLAYAQNFMRQSRVFDTRGSRKVKIYAWWRNKWPIKNTNNRYKCGQSANFIVFRSIIKFVSDNRNTKYEYSKDLAMRIISSLMSINKNRPSTLLTRLIPFWLLSISDIKKYPENTMSL